ncbi:MAG: hypothetical protein EXS05_07895 [Planctomycetaceae bacterium]|nr:hypothetical protein [Planctomycetaceae bacterium]
MQPRLGIWDANFGAAAGFDGRKYWGIPNQYLGRSDRPQRLIVFSDRAALDKPGPFAPGRQWYESAPIHEFLKVTSIAGLDRNSLCQAARKHNPVALVPFREGFDIPCEPWSNSKPAYLHRMWSYQVRLDGSSVGLFELNLKTCEAGHSGPNPLPVPLSGFTITRVDAPEVSMDEFDKLVDFESHVGEARTIQRIH